MKQIDTSRYLTSVVKSELQTTYNYRLKVKHRLNRAFNIIPNNSIINKGRCGIGGTFLELRAKRNSIIIVPTNAIIDNKCFKNGVILPNYFVVRGKFSDKDFLNLKQFIESDLPNKKIFSTPEGLRKVMSCKADRAGIRRDWFLLFDESHTSITENYRKRILDAFNFFFLFENKALISATPYNFSHEGFDTFDVYNIKFRGKVGKVRIENTNNVSELLHTKLINPTAYPGRVHIFLNSVTDIANTIRISSTNDYSIFCKEDRKNIKKLDELRSHLKDSPCEASYSKFNFYTSKYYEGWDLYDFNATIIIVTDITSLTLMNGVSNKCVQAVGRNRYYSNQIIHITNSRDTLLFDKLEDIQRLTNSTAERAILDYNSHIEEVFYGRETYDVNYYNLVKPYADINQPDGVAYINKFKVDQVINQAYTSQEYNDISYIIKAWESAHFSTSFVDEFVPNLPTNIKKLSKTNRIKVMVEHLEEFEGKYEGRKMNESLYNDYINRLPLDTKKICNDYLEIGGSKMKGLGYDPKLIDQCVIESKNEKGLCLVKADYIRIMGKRECLITDEIVPLLQSLYIKYKILNPKTATVKTASGTDLNGYFTDVKKDRIGTKNTMRIVEF